MNQWKAVAAPLVLDGWLPPRELSPNARVHWAAKAKAVRVSRTDLGWRVYRLQWPCQGTARRRLTITMRRPRLLDSDNATSICKSLCDGVVDAGALVDDSPRWLELVVRQEKGAARTTLEIEEEVE